MVLVQEHPSHPLEDLSHVLLRWQEAGIAIGVFGTKQGAAPALLAVNRPSRFRALYQRGFEILGLRRGVAGGFGGWPQGTGGG